MTDYQQKAKDFCQKTGTIYTCTFLYRGKYFESDKQLRDVYTITISRGTRSYTTNFGQSFISSGRFMYKHFGEHYFNDRAEAIRAAIKAGVYQPKFAVKPNPKFEEPDEYTFLSGLQTYDPGDFNSFCSDMGYNDRPLRDYPTVQKIYDNVLKEWNAILSMYNDEELTELQALQ